MPGQQMKQNIALGLGLDSSVNFGSANQLQLGWILKTLVWWAGFVWQPRKVERDLKQNKKKSVSWLLPSYGEYIYLLIFWICPYSWVDWFWSDVKKFFGLKKSDYPMSTVGGFTRTNAISKLQLYQNQEE